MKTEQLINALVADIGPRRSFLRSFVYATASGVAFDAVVFFAAIGPRPDIAAAAETWRFLFKFVVTLALAVPATTLAYRLAAPAMWRRCRFEVLMVLLCLLLAATAFELDLVPPSLWMVRLVGSNSVNCMTLIPVLALAPLTCFLILLRSGASCDPGLTGAVAGLAAGAIAATFYALNCFDDSPLFVITWYPIAMSTTAAGGYYGGRRFLTW
ncbi:NrsF family protein [Bradyrhizobium sp. WYCCWR 13023]|uniref:NrsF family protein n=1 Tax=Bradyrhizobium zhengyangense TaxID=2911009 RepID=A0A9X1U7Y2_9BRAD|nr:NrsF family protein [Bradyrhizobium zhengyangense]MCG2627316.1 NrsF family protein [Bradyrhizobium zhengyangense]